LNSLQSSARPSGSLLHDVSIDSVRFARLLGVPRAPLGGLPPSLPRLRPWPRGCRCARSASARTRSTCARHANTLFRRRAHTSGTRPCSCLSCRLGAVQHDRQQRELLASASSAGSQGRGAWCCLRACGVRARASSDIRARGVGQPLQLLAQRGLGARHMVGSPQFAPARREPRRVEMVGQLEVSKLVAERQNGGAGAESGREDDR
jgi:hypothetical protein